MISFKCCQHVRTIHHSEDCHDSIVASSSRENTRRIKINVIDTSVPGCDANLKSRENAVLTRWLSVTINCGSPGVQCLCLAGKAVTLNGGT